MPADEEAVSGALCGNVTVPELLTVGCVGLEVLLLPCLAILWANIGRCDFLALAKSGQRRLLFVLQPVANNKRDKAGMYSEVHSRFIKANFLLRIKLGANVEDRLGEFWFV